MTELSEDLRKFLSECEKTYASRFSDEDQTFKDYCRNPQRGPPIEERWFGRQPRQFDRNDRGGRRDDRRDFGRGDRGHRGDYHSREGGREGHRDDRDNRYNRGPSRDHGRDRYNPYGRPDRGHQDRPRY